MSFWRYIFPPSFFSLCFHLLFLGRNVEKLRCFSFLGSLGYPPCRRRLPLHPLEHSGCRAGRQTHVTPVSPPIPRPSHFLSLFAFTDDVIRLSAPCLRILPNLRRPLSPPGSKPPAHQKKKKKKNKGSFFSLAGLKFPSAEALGQVPRKRASAAGTLVLPRLL